MSAQQASLRWDQLSSYPPCELGIGLTPNVDMGILFPYSSRLVMHWKSVKGHQFQTRYCIFKPIHPWRFGLTRILFSGRRLDIHTGQQTYRALKVKLILLVTNDQKTKNVIKFNPDFLFQHILNYIILYWDKEDFLKKANFALKWLFNKK